MMMINKLSDIKDPIDQDLASLLIDLIELPSFIPDDRSKSKNQNENKVVDYLEKRIKKNTGFSVEKQRLNYGRYNLIAKKGKPDIVFLGHTDTVAPSENSPFNQLKGVINQNKIWGRGSADMKSGIAAMLQAVELAKDVDNIWLIFYADEEYDFLGMKSLVEKYSYIKPKLIVSSDGSDLQFGHGCRGLIEFRVRFLGISGHPARGTGNSAIQNGMICLNKLEKFVKEHKHPVMGESSFNIAYVLGGASRPDSKDKDGHLSVVGQAGNVVSDVLEFVLDIRPAIPDLTPDKIFNFLSEETKKLALGFEIVEKTHNYGAWYTDIKELKQYQKNGESAISQKIVIDNPGKGGYIDLQMLWDKVGRPPAFMFGGGKGTTAHAPDEHIEIPDLLKTRDFFLSFLESFL